VFAIVSGSRAIVDIIAPTIRFGGARMAIRELETLSFA
jgi:hypothetical protein